MKRWNQSKGKETESKKIDNFLDEIKNVYLKYGYALSHEDHHGGFIIKKYDDKLTFWLFDASNDTGEDEDEN